MVPRLILIVGMLLVSRRGGREGAREGGRESGALIGALEKKGWGNEVDEGEGVFYGPKIDLYIRDAIGTYLQVLFSLPSSLPPSINN